MLHCRMINHRLQGEHDVACAQRDGHISKKRDKDHKTSHREPHHCVDPMLTELGTVLNWATELGVKYFVSRKTSERAGNFNFLKDLRVITYFVLKYCLRNGLKIVDFVIRQRVQLFPRRSEKNGN